MDENIYRFSGAETPPSNTLISRSTTDADGTAMDPSMVPYGERASDIENEIDALTRETAGDWRPAGTVRARRVAAAALSAAQQQQDPRLAAAGSGSDNDQEGEDGSDRIQSSDHNADDVDSDIISDGSDLYPHYRRRPSKAVTAPAVAESSSSSVPPKKQQQQQRQRHHQRSTVRVRPASSPGKAKAAAAVPTVAITAVPPITTTGNKHSKPTAAATTTSAALTPAPVSNATTGKKGTPAASAASASKEVAVAVTPPRRAEAVMIPLSPVQSFPGVKPRRIADGAPDGLPAALEGLYLAAITSEQQHKQQQRDPSEDSSHHLHRHSVGSGGIHTTPLLYVLQLAATECTVHRRRAAARAGRDVEANRCRVLHAMAAKKKEKDEAFRLMERLRREEELAAACPFAPRVTAAARKILPKGTDAFMEKCVEWQAGKDAKLAARYARDGAQTTATSTAVGEPMMNPHSRRITDRLAREGGDTRPALWEQRSAERGLGLTGPKHLTTATATALGADAGQHSGTSISAAATAAAPVTAREERRQRRRLKRILAGTGSALSDASRSSSSASSSSAVTSSSSSSSTLSGADGSHTRSSRRHRHHHRHGARAAYVARMEADAARRAQAAEKLHRKQEDSNGGAHYSEVTGQALFTPNAMPTAMSNGRRVPYGELSPAEQKEFRRFLQRSGQGYVLGRLVSRRGGDLSTSDSGGGGDTTNTNTTSSGAPRQRPSFAGDVDAALAAAADSRQRGMARITAAATAEETFSPHISDRSAWMAKRKVGTAKIYERPTPPRFDAEVVKKERSAERRRQEEEEGRYRSRHPHNSINNTSVTSDQHGGSEDSVSRAMAERVIARSVVWQERREGRRRALAARLAAEEQAACTFTPARAAAHRLAPSFNANASPSCGDSHSGHRRPTYMSDVMSLEYDPLATNAAGRRNNSNGNGNAHVDPSGGVYTGVELGELAAAAEVRVANDVELLRARTADMDPEFLARVFGGGHGRGGGSGGPRHINTNVSDTNAAFDNSRSGRAKRLGAAVVGLKRTPQYRLEALTRINAPPLNSGGGSSGVSFQSGADRHTPPPPTTTGMPRPAAAHTAKPSGIRGYNHDPHHHHVSPTPSALPHPYDPSPVDVLSCLTAPSVSRSPNRDRWRQVVMSGAGHEDEDDEEEEERGYGDGHRRYDHGTDGHYYNHDDGDDESLSQLSDPWAALDAQVDLILRRYE